MSEINSGTINRLSRRYALGLGLGTFVAAAGGLPYHVFLLEGDRANAQEQLDVEKFMKAGDLPENEMGEKDAPVTIVEYSSLTCPHCASFHNTTVPELKEKYIKTGKVRYIIREFPLDRLAFAASAVVRCAGPEKFFAFTEALYKQQQNWASGEGNPAQRLFNMAKQAGFTQDTFNSCMRDEKVINHINETRKKGSEDFGVSSTPTLFVNGKKLDGGNSLADIEKAMEPFLKG